MVFNMHVLTDLNAPQTASRGASNGRMMARGFTIVELLVVIVVIAILAAISVATYTGVQDRAKRVAIQSDLRNFAKLAEMYRLDNDRYPSATVPSLDRLNFKASKAAYPSGTGNFDYCTDSSYSQYILYVHISSDRLNGMYVSSNDASPRQITHEPPYNLSDGSPCYSAHPHNSAASAAGLTGIAKGLTGLRSDGTWSPWTE